VIRALLVLLVACGGTGGVGKPGIRGTREPADGEGHARVWQRTASGGTIELAGDRAAARQESTKEMDDHCGPGNYRITHEGEEVVEYYDDVTQNMITSTVWRVYYECAGTGP
jgi:hypothetical protein